MRLLSFVPMKIQFQRSSTQVTNEKGKAYTRSHAHSKRGRNKKNETRASSRYFGLPKLTIQYYLKATRETQETL